MTEQNPYTPPSADVVERDNVEYELASRWRRLGGAIIDGILLGVATLAIVFASGLLNGITEDSLSLAQTLFLAASGIIVFFLLNGYFLANSGQTIGKKLLQMQIVSVETNKILPFGKLVGLRYVPIWIIGYIPLIGSVLNLINVLFIFGEEKRCAHDYIAGTKVINIG